MNPAQRAAVENFEGPSLIIAGAGSGKTRVLTSRIAYMIERGVAPFNILALTFTNKAANEMRERIDQQVGSRSRHIYMGTFHSIFLRILRAEAEKIGYPPAFTIYDTTDSISLIKSICREMLLPDDIYKPRALAAKISRLKNDLITPAVYEEDPVFVADDRKRQQPQFIEVYKRYVARCKANGAMDFDDLLVNMVVLFKQNRDVLAEYQKRFKYILVDEYQDTNHVQYLIVKALAMAHGNVCVVGDDSQSIYSFRGARIENILNFTRDFPTAKIYKLEQNYRSTQTIVNAANSVIARNRSSRDLKKECFSDGEVGENIRLIGAYTDREEAELVATEIRDLGRRGASWDEIAVIYRINVRSRVIEETLRRRDIPYKIYGGHSFYNHKEIKDLLGYFRLIVNPRDDEAFKRVINYPARGIGDVTVSKIAALAAERGVSMWEAVKIMNTTAATKEEITLAKKTATFMELIQGLSLERTQLGLYQFGREVATRTGIIGVFKAENTVEAISALENIEELLNSMEIFREQRATEATEEGTDLEVNSLLEEWLQSVALITDMDNDDPENHNKVMLMSVHAAKGLEFRYVFIVGMEEEQFPALRGGDQTELEEERRLFYVALTRAKEAVWLSYAGQIYQHGKTFSCNPSRFLREIDEKYIDGAKPVKKPATTSGWGESGKGGWGESGKAIWEPRKSAPPVKVTPITPDARFKKVVSQPAQTPDNVLRPAPEGSTFAAGMRVRHAKFGRGTVEDVEIMAGAQSSADLKITVIFDDPTAGRKTLLSKFAKLEIL
ncbi:MAG: exodeoxyribonuclease V subunit gamma [Rikenellaceae bacterium]|nr:exodeoxyribonuclease V subunit gamma [Rikenellaceae bacterium]